MSGERGFTLLEVLVAFVIAALALAALYQGSLGGLLASRVAAHTTEAVARAQSHLAAVGHSSAIVAADTGGDDGGGYRWRLLIQEGTAVPITDTAARAGMGTGRGARAVLYAVTVWVSWQGDGGTRSVRLDSSRLDSSRLGSGAAPGP